MIDECLFPLQQPVARPKFTNSGPEEKHFRRDNLPVHLQRLPTPPAPPDAPPPPPKPQPLPPTPPRVPSESEEEDVKKEKEEEEEENEEEKMTEPAMPPPPQVPVPPKAEETMPPAAAESAATLKPKARAPAPRPSAAPHIPSVQMDAELAEARRIGRDLRAQMEQKEYEQFLQEQAALAEAQRRAAEAYLAAQQQAWQQAEQEKAAQDAMVQAACQRGRTRESQEYGLRSANLCDPSLDPEPDCMSDVNDDDNTQESREQPQTEDNIMCAACFCCANKS